MWYMHNDMTEKHIIVVGGGTAGTFLTFCLLKKGFRVTLIDEELDSLQHVSRNTSWQDYFGLAALEDLWTIEAEKSDNVEIFNTAPQKSLKNRVIGYPCGKGIGGNSNINAMMHGIGHEFVYDEYWPRPWSSDIVRQYEKSVDSMFIPSTQTTAGRMSNLFDHIFKDASSKNASNAVVRDYLCCVSSSGKKRLKLIKLLEKLPEHTYEKLMLMKGKVTHCIMNGSKIASICVNGEIMPIPENGHVVLCCGAVKSPEILHNTLTTFLHDAKNEKSSLSSAILELKRWTGRTALDHFILPYVCFGNWRASWPSSVETPLNGIHGWIFLDENGDYHNNDSKIPPRTQLILVDGSILAGLAEVIIPKWREQSIFWRILRSIVVGVLKLVLQISIVRWLLQGTFGVLVCLVQPTSQGECIFNDNRISSTKEKSENRNLASEGLHNICIDPKLFSNKNDQVALHAAYLKAREIFQTSSREGHISYVELLPGPLLNHAISLSTFVEFASWIGTTYFHICGTCPMDRYANGMVQSFGVVSDNLQVKGIDNLSIADASVFPAIPSFPTAKLSMIVGARAADFLCSNSSEGTQLLKNSRPKVKAKMQL